MSSIIGWDGLDHSVYLYDLLVFYLVLSIPNLCTNLALNLDD